MNVSGPGGAIPTAYRLPPVARPAVPPPPVEVGRTAERAAAPAGNEPAPPGSDPALWSVLTAEERRFFTQQAALGPIHYGPRSVAPVSTAPLGGRIDVRG